MAVKDIVVPGGILMTCHYIREECGLRKSMPSLTANKSREFNEVMVDVVINITSRASVLLVNSCGAYSSGERLLRRIRQVWRDMFWS